tara:strand:+ start:2656 stop:2919 length:264 start_codon:yes stop_codon:yes gene_type:complete
MPTKTKTRAAKAPKSRTASRRCAVSTRSAISPIGPSSDDYNAWLAKRPDIVARMNDAAPKFTTHSGYEIWRNGWLACVAVLGIRKPE